MISGNSMSGECEASQSVNIKDMFPPAETTTHSTRMLKKRWLGMEMQERVKLQKKEFEVFQNAMCERKKKLKEKEKEMQHRIQTSHFLKCNADQRQIAERKVRCFMELIKKKQEHLQKLKKERDTLVTQWQLLKKQTEANCIFTDYIDAVIQQTKQFKEQQELIMNYEAWMLQLEDLFACKNRRSEKLQKCRDDLAWNSNEYTHTVMNNKTRLNVLESKLEEADQCLKKSEARMDNICSSMNRNAQLKATIMLGTSGIFRNVWNKGNTNLQPVTIEETIDMLHKIQKFVIDMRVTLMNISRPESKGEKTVSRTAF